METNSRPSSFASSAQQRMVELLATLAPAEGYTQSRLPGVKFMRANRPSPRHAVMYEPCIVIVCQGRKRGYLGERTFVYDAQQYLVMSVPLPFEAETEASPEEPFLGISVRVDLTMAAELLLQIDEARAVPFSEPQGIYSTPLDKAMSDAVLRLLEVLVSPLETRILGPSVVREICFRVLTGVQGNAIRAALNYHNHFGRIAKALRRIHADYRGDLDVDTLAGEASMSVPVFHTQFKAVTSTSPMQYVKATRLHQARLLMLQDGLNASTAAARVGYESPSQFSREFKRLFGLSPVDELRRLRIGIGAPSQPEPEPPSGPRYVSTG